MQVVALCYAYQGGHHCAISLRARRRCSALLLGGVVTRGFNPAGTFLGNVVTWSRRRCLHLGLHGYKLKRVPPGAARTRARLKLRILPVPAARAVPKLRARFFVCSRPPTLTAATAAAATALTAATASAAESAPQRRSEFPRGRMLVHAQAGGQRGAAVRGEARGH